MCDPNYIKTNSSNVQNKVNEHSASTSTNLFASENVSNIYLQTACARIVLGNSANKNDAALVRLVLDGGSQLTFIKECVSRKLNLPIIGTHKIAVMTFGKNEMAPARLCKRVALTLQGLHGNSEPIRMSAVEVPEICFDSLVAPSQSDPILQSFSRNHQLTDVSLNDPDVLSGISILVEADAY